MSDKENYKRFKTEKNSVEIVSSQNYIPPLRKSPLHWSLSSVFACTHTHTHTCVHKERGRRGTSPEPGGFSLAPLQNVGGLLYFCLGGKEANGPCWDKRWGLPVPPAADAQEAEHGRSSRMGSAARPASPSRLSPARRFLAARRRPRGSLPLPLRNQAVA